MIINYNYNDVNSVNLIFQMNISSTSWFLSLSLEKSFLERTFVLKKNIFSDKLAI